MQYQCLSRFKLYMIFQIFWYQSMWISVFFCLSAESCGNKTAMDRSHNGGLWAWWKRLDSDISLAGFIAVRVRDRADQQRVVLLNVWGCSQSPQKCIQVRVAHLNIKACEKIQHTIIWDNYTIFKRFQIHSSTVYESLSSWVCVWKILNSIFCCTTSLRDTVLDLVYVENIDHYV